MLTLYIDISIFHESFEILTVVASTGRRCFYVLCFLIIDGAVKLAMSKNLHAVTTSLTTPFTFDHYSNVIQLQRTAFIFVNYLAAFYSHFQYFQFSHCLCLKHWSALF